MNICRVYGEFVKNRDNVRIIIGWDDEYEFGEYRDEGGLMVVGSMLMGFWVG